MGDLDRLRRIVAEHAEREDLRRTTDRSYLDLGRYLREFEIDPTSRQELIRTDKF